jgi:hypothetical protein
MGCSDEISIVLVYDTNTFRSWVIYLPLVSASDAAVTLPDYNRRSHFRWVHQTICALSRQKILILFQLFVWSRESLCVLNPINIYYLWRTSQAGAAARIRELTSLSRCSNTHLHHFIAFIAFYSLVAEAAQVRWWYLLELDKCFPKCNVLTITCHVVQYYLALGSSTVSNADIASSLCVLLF